MLLDKTFTVIINEYGADTDHYEVLWNMASIQSLKGNKLEALSYIRKMIGAGFRIHGLARLDPNLLLLHNDSEFQEMMNEVATKVAVMRDLVISQEKQ